MDDGPLRVESNRQIDVASTEVKEKPAAPVKEDVLAKVEEIGVQLRAAIIAAKRLPRDGYTDPHQDPARSLALAQAHLQTGFMWLRRAIENPKVF